MPVQVNESGVHVAVSVDFAQCGYLVRRVVAMPAPKEPELATIVSSRRYDDDTQTKRKGRNHFVGVLVPSWGSRLKLGREYAQCISAHGFGEAHC